MAYTTISNHKSQFSVKNYTGNGTDNTAITGVGHQPSIIWSKNMTDAGTNHYFIDAVRGVTKRTYTSSSSAEGTDATLLKSFDSDGFTLGDGSINQSGKSFISYLWKGGTTSGITTNGTTMITPSSYSFNQTNGMSIIKWAGNGVDNSYIPHGLGKAPKMIWVKALGLSEDWQVYAEGAGNQGRGWLSYSNTWSTGRGEWGSFTPDTVNFRVSNDSHMNASGSDYIAYCFADITGYQKILSWTTNGASDPNAPFLYCGFSPKFFLLWNISNGGRQGIVDIFNAPFNPNGKVLYPHSTNAITTTGDYACDLVSNGIKVRANATSNINHTNGNIYVALAIGQTLVGSNNIPATAK
jgi:hypothetical protein